jgi:multiple sugar transport system permease protein
MSAIDTSVYEAAELDGVNWWKKVTHITLPLIKNVVNFTIVLNIIHAFSQMYSYVLVMTNGGPGYESTVLEYFIYLKGFRAGDMGYASALSVILFVLVLTVSLIMSAYNKRKGE